MCWGGGRAKERARGRERGREEKGCSCGGLCALARFPSFSPAATADQRDHASSRDRARPGAEQGSGRRQIDECGPERAGAEGQRLSLWFFGHRSAARLWKRGSRMRGRAWGRSATYASPSLLLVPSSMRRKEGEEARQRGGRSEKRRGGRGWEGGRRRRRRRPPRPCSRPPPRRKNEQNAPRSPRGLARSLNATAQLTHVTFLESAEGGPCRARQDAWGRTAALDAPSSPRSRCCCCAAAAAVPPSSSRAASPSFAGLCAGAPYL